MKLSHARKMAEEAKGGEVEESRVGGARQFPLGKRAATVAKTFGFQLGVKREREGERGRRLVVLLRFCFYRGLSHVLLPENLATKRET